MIPPSGNTSFDVVFLGRDEGLVENTLYIHTSAGSFRFIVSAVGTPNPYRLKPLVGVKMPLNSSYRYMSSYKRVTLQEFHSLFFCVKTLNLNASFFQSHDNAPQPPSGAHSSPGDVFIGRRSSPRAAGRWNRGSASSVANTTVSGTFLMPQNTIRNVPKKVI